jgi:hypothetical protein
MLVYRVDWDLVWIVVFGGYCAMAGLIAGESIVKYSPAVLIGRGRGGDEPRSSLNWCAQAQAPH